MHEGLAYGPNWQNVHWYNNYIPSSVPSATWNTYAVKWLPDQMVFYMDGHVEYSVTGAQVPHIPMYIILNNGVASQTDGKPPAKTSDFEVKWVKVFSQPSSPSS